MEYKFEEDLIQRSIGEKRYLPYLINAEKDYLEGKNQNSLRKQDIDKIVKTYDSYGDVDKYARVIDISEIEENDFNLNVRRYIDSSEEQEVIDVKKVWHELKTLEAERDKINIKVSKFIKGLGYENF